MPNNVQTPEIEKADPGLGLLLDAKVDADEGQVSNIDDPKKLLRKLDLVLMPLILGTWFIQTLDKATLGTAAIFNIIEEAKLVKNQFSWLSSLFFVGWIVWEYPANVLLQRFPVGKTLGATVMAWGAVLMCHAAGNNFAELAVVRTLLGALEAGCNPACMIAFGMFYTRDEQPLRMGMWIGFGGVANIISGILSYGVGHIRGALSTWKVMYLIYGGFTIVWGGFLWLLFPDSPMKARFLNEDEKKGVILRIAGNGTGVENKQWKKAQFIETMKDVKSWLFFALSLSINAPTGVFMNFQGLIIKSLGYSGLQTTLMTMPSGAMMLIGCTGASYFATRFKNLRIAMSLLFILPFFAGIIGLRVLDHSNPWGRLVSLWLCFFFASPYGIGMALVNANTAGHTKRITTNAMFIIGAGIGSFIGPFFFDSRQAPYYTMGFDFMFAAFALEVTVLVALFFVLWRRNKSKRLARGDRQADSWAGNESGFLDKTDIENINFVYVY